MDLKGTVEHGEVTAEVLFTKGIPDYPGQSETQRRNADESFSPLHQYFNMLHHWLTHPLSQYL